MELVEVLIQGGAVGIALALCFILYRKDQSTERLVGNHLKSETKAKLKQAVALQKLAGAIDLYFNKNGKNKSSKNKD